MKASMGLMAIVTMLPFNHTECAEGTRMRMSSPERDKSRI